jgi:GNAT superfamily N-acetyltransferase
MTELPICAHCERPALYQDRTTGDMLCLDHVRLEVRGPRAPVGARAEQLRFRRSESADREVIRQMWEHFWEDTAMDCFGKLYQAADLPALLACDGEQVVGLLSYAVERVWDAVNLVALNVLAGYQGQGIAAGLIARLEDEARRLGINRLIVATANDNPLALYFYQRIGFQLTGVQVGVIPPDGGGDALVGLAGIPVRDEIQLEKRL